MMTNQVKRLISLGLSGSMIFAIAACGKTEQPSSGTTGNSSQSTTPTATKSDEPVDIFAKYDPEIDMTAWRFINSGIKFADGDDIENNVYIDYYKEEFGINLKYSWVVPEEQFEQKLNISVASGDLPDLMWLNNKNLIELAENDLLYDLTDLYETYTTDFTKSILEQDITSFNTAKIDGKLMAIPHTGSAIDSLQALYIREDWLDHLGLQIPTNMQELLAVAEAFTKNDPDNNNKNDTYGLALTKNFIGDNHAGATGFFAGYHGYARRWIEDGSGDLVYGSTQPEVKEALLQLQSMYKNGLLDPEFGVKDRAKVAESIASGKIGITYGGMSSPGAFLKDSVLNDPNAEWKVLELLSVDSSPAKPITKMPVTRYYAVNKNFKHPEALLKIAEAISEGYSREQEESKWELGHSKDGIAVFQYQVVGYEPAKKNLNAHFNVLEALEKNDTSILNTEELGYYEKISQYRAGDRNFWGEERIFGTPSSFDIIGKYVESNNYLYNKFYGSMTPTMVERNATLEAMEDEVFTNIIMGADISAFDKFVEDWKKLGGEAITKEVNEWYGKSK